MVWTTPQDIKDLYIGSAVLPTDLKLAKLISVVENNILRVYPEIQTRIDNETLSLETITTSVATWVIEYLHTGGEGITQESQAYPGAASRSVTYSSGQRRNTLLLTDADLAIFAPVDSGKAFALDLAHHANTGHGRIWIPYDEFFPSWRNN